MKSVILAGGLGTRLSEETLVGPKPMVAIGGKPIPWDIIKAYTHAGVLDFETALGAFLQVENDLSCRERSHWIN